MTTMSSKTTGYKLTKADLRQINIRNLVGFQAGWNYERMQHSGYLWIILPQLRKIYGDNTEALKTACRTQCSPFFNTSNFLNTFRCKQTYIAYDQGMKLVTTMSDKLNAITDAATVMGVFMVGALISTNVGIVLTINPNIGGVPLNVQDILNNICPKIVPAALVGFVYWLLGRKGMTSTKAIFVVLVLGVVLGALELVAKG